MRRSRSALDLGVALLAFAGVSSALLTGGANRGEVSTCGSLSIVARPKTPDGVLSDAAFVSAQQEWAVGDTGSDQHANRTLIERFVGSQWSIVPSPNEGSADNGLNGVSMTSHAGWAVGYAQVNGSFEPLAMDWDGQQWSLDSPPKLTGNSLLTGVDALADGSAWAVGFQLTTGGTRRTLIEQESGQSWKPVASPNVAASTGNSLMSVAGTQATGLWAVGYWLSPTGLKPLVLRYDTTSPSPSWVQVSGVPSPGMVDTVLTSVAVLTASDVWAVGYYNDGSADRPLALHWDGRTWSSSAISGAGLLRKVRAVSSGNVWATGSYYVPGEQRYKTLVVHFNGTAWNTVLSADSKYDDQLAGLGTNPAGSVITVLGRDGSNSLIEQANCPTGPVSLPAVAAAPVPPVPAAPGTGPAPSPPPKTPPPVKPIGVKITDQAAAAGINLPPDWSFSAAIADFNGDGSPDIFASHHWHPANLWINNGNGTFSAADVNFFSSILDRHDCQAADFNKDGKEDIFCSVGADRGTGLKCNGLFIQQPQLRFADEAYQENVCDPTGRGRWSAVLDVNNDGYPDIFYGTEELRQDGLPSIDRLYLNTGHSSFIDSPGMGLDLNIGSLCAHTVDYNDDGWPDLLVCGNTGGLHLFRNDQGHGFTNVSSILGPPVNATDAAMVNVNHDSRPDLITLTSTTVAERLQLANGTFGPPKTLLTVKAGMALAVGDVNGDHNPDIYVVCGRVGNENAPDYLLIGNASGGFKTQSIPQTTVGYGEVAYPIDYNNSGLTSFLVLNGQAPFTGPVQLLTPSPS